MICEPCSCHAICSDYLRWMIVGIAIMVSNNYEIGCSWFQCSQSIVYQKENINMWSKQIQFKGFWRKPNSLPGLDVLLVFKHRLIHSVLSNLRFKSLIWFNAVLKFLICLDCFTKNILSLQSFYCSNIRQKNRPILRGVFYWFSFFSTWMRYCFIRLSTFEFKSSTYELVFVSTLSWNRLRFDVRNLAAAPPNRTLGKCSEINEILVQLQLIRQRCNELLLKNKPVS